MKKSGISLLLVLIGVFYLALVSSCFSGKETDEIILEEKEPSIINPEKMGGIYYNVQEAETLAILSQRFRVPMEVIIETNSIKDDVVVGTEIYIPNPWILEHYTELYSLNRYFLTDRYINPVDGDITGSSFGWQKVSDSDTYIFNPGITINTKGGAKVRAALSGKVVDIGVSPVHGKYVVLYHGDHYYTFYSNLSEVLIKKYASQGRIIGLANSENCLGFGLFRGNQAIDPLRIIETTRNYRDSIYTIDASNYHFDDEKGYIYTIMSGDNGPYIRIDGYYGQDRVVRIPDKINGLPVRETGYKSFYNCVLTGVVIPRGVTHIGRSSFNNNYIKKLQISDTVVEIGADCFKGNEIKHVKIPRSVTTIGDYSFCRNKISRLNIPDNVTSLGRGAFSHNKLTRIIISNSITELADSVFEDNKLRNISIPPGVRRIGSCSFEDNQLTNVIIPSGVTVIERSAFALNNIRHVNLSASVESIEESAFEDNKIKSLVLPSGVKRVKSNAFLKNRITRFTIGDNVTLEHRDYWTETLFPEEIFELGFDEYYLSNESRDGVYVYKNGSWTIE